MMPICDFVGTLAVAGKSFKEIQQICQKCLCRQGTIKRTQMHDILKNKKEGKLVADQRHLNSKRKKRSLVFIANAAADIEND
jgi:hypothetical protein